MYHVHIRHIIQRFYKKFSGDLRYYVHHISQNLFSIILTPGMLSIKRTTKKNFWVKLLRSSDRYRNPKVLVRLTDKKVDIDYKTLIYLFRNFAYLSLFVLPVFLWDLQSNVSLVNWPLTIKKKEIFRFPSQMWTLVEKSSDTCHHLRNERVD